MIITYSVTSFIYEYSVALFTILYNTEIRHPRYGFLKFTIHSPENKWNEKLFELSHIH